LLLLSGVFLAFSFFSRSDGTRVIRCDSFATLYGY
jgi:hypothetical protein